MNTQIRNSSDGPIYLQVKNQLKHAIATSELAVGEQLLSIRLLVKGLRISIITTKRAYDELEEEGLINSVVGKGNSIATQNFELLRGEYLRKLETVLRGMLKYAALAQLDRAELLEMIDLLDEELGGSE